MKKYLAVFVASIEAYDKMKEEMKSKTPEESKKGMDEWMVWMEQHKSDIVDSGAPVGAAKRVEQGGKITDLRNTIGGYMIVQSESHDAAAKIFADSPHFGVSGSGVEVMEIMQM